MIQEELEIAAKIRGIDRELFLDADLEIIDRFVQFEKVRNFPKLLLVIIGILGSFSGAFGLAMLIEANKFLARKAAERAAK